MQVVPIVLHSFFVNASAIQFREPHVLFRTAVFKCSVGP